MSPTWDILMCSIFHRTELLTEVLDALAPQIVPGVGVHVYRDNLECGYGEKCQALLDSSTADYVSFLDDDDMVEPDFVSEVMGALAQAPDYVGFRVRWTDDGHPMLPVIHSLQFDNWRNEKDCLYRDIVHFNPIRRELALQGTWSGGNGADQRWATELRALGCVKTEVFIDRELHHYRRRQWDVFDMPREPYPESPPRPEQPFVTYLDA